MTIDILKTIPGGFIASIIWFIIGGALYMNPFVAKIYKNAEGSLALKKWPNVPKYLALRYIGVLVQCLLWAFVFVLVKTALPAGVLKKGFYLGLSLLL